MFQGVSKWFQRDPMGLQLTSTGFKGVFWGKALHRLAGDLLEEFRVDLEIYQSVSRYFMAFKGIFPGLRGVPGDFRGFTGF